MCGVWVVRDGVYWDWFVGRYWDVEIWVGLKEWLFMCEWVEREWVGCNEWWERVYNKREIGFNGYDDIFWLVS